MFSCCCSLQLFNCITVQFIFQLFYFNLYFFLLPQSLFLPSSVLPAETLFPVVSMWCFILLHFYFYSSAFTSPKNLCSFSTRLLQNHTCLLQDKHHQTRAGTGHFFCSGALPSTTIDECVSVKSDSACSCRVTEAAGESLQEGGRMWLIRSFSFDCCWGCFLLWTHTRSCLD